MIIPLLQLHSCDCSTYDNAPPDATACERAIGTTQEAVKQLLVATPLRHQEQDRKHNVRATDKLKVHFVEPMTYEMTPELLRVVRSSNSRPFNYFYARKPQHDQQHS
jgi:hypothetical protein